MLPLNKCKEGGVTATLGKENKMEQIIQLDSGEYALIIDGELYYEGTLEECENMSFKGKEA